MEAVSQSQPFAISADCRVNQPSLLHLLSLLLPGHTYLLGSNILGCIWVFQLRQAAASSQSTSVWTSLTLAGKDSGRRTMPWAHRGQQTWEWMYEPGHRLGHRGLMFG